jgi:hypothetical protein
VWTNISCILRSVRSFLFTDATLQFFIVTTGSVYLEHGGRYYWGADNFFTGGSTYSISAIPISNTADDSIYQTERLGLFSYQIPVPIGIYEINIHLAELYVSVFFFKIACLKFILICIYLPCLHLKGLHDKRTTNFQSNSGRYGI